MRVISAKRISDAVADLCIKANIFLRPDVLKALKLCRLKESNKRSKKILDAIIENSSVSVKEKLAICQDTGMPVVFVELGQGIKLKGDLRQAINKGIESGYRKGYFRESIVREPLLRGKPGYVPAVIHLDIVKGDKIKLTVLPKGFGCENKSSLKMLKPTDDLNQIKQFIIDTVKSAGPDACPPYIVGVGIGGTADYAMFLAKKALLKRLYAKRYTCLVGRQALNAKLESDLLKEINKLNIGPMGLGGKVSALAVNVKTYPTHIAGLPVAVNISCHALRSASVVL